MTWFFWKHDVTRKVGQIKPLPYRIQFRNVDKIAVQIDYNILHHIKVGTHETLHSNKYLPNFVILNFYVGSNNIRYVIFQKQVLNRVHTMFNHRRIQKTDKTQIFFYYAIFHKFAKNLLDSTFLVNHISSHKCMFTCYYPYGKYWSPKRSKGVPSNIPRSSPKHPIWPSRAHYHLIFWLVVYWICLNFILLLRI